MKKRIVHAAAVLAAGAVAASATEARAQTLMNCATDYPHPVYVSGSTAVEPVFQQIAIALGTQVSIIYQGPGSCVGLGDVVMGTQDSSKATPIGPDGVVNQNGCTLPTSGINVDIGVSDVYPATCGAAFAVGAGRKEFLGPIQVMSLVVPINSSESSINADAAYMVFGFAGVAPNQIAPWTDPTEMNIRGAGSGTLNMIGSAIGLPASKWMPGTMYDMQRRANSNAVLTNVTAATNPNAAIGILAADYADAHRDAIKTLAFQATGQGCGYLPDSTSTAFDKINVRQGRYAIWGPAHMVANVDSTGTPVKADAATVLNYFTGNGLTVAQKQLMINVESAAFTIPQCAMQVIRTSEIGAEASYQPDEPCGCYYESLKGTPVSTCTACPNGDSDCSAPTPTCRFGFCEAQ